VSVVAQVPSHPSLLPDTPYNLWLRDELADLLLLPHDGTRVEIIGGEIVVSPGPEYRHNRIIRQIERCMLTAELGDPSFPWRHVQSQDVNLSDIHDGYIPDLCILHEENDRRAEEEGLKKLLPEHLHLAVEVTSPTNASDDRRPSARRSTPTKWNGCARAGVPYYLLVDRAPKAARTTLFSIPDRDAGEYRDANEWKFGETIRLPEPFGFDIPTDSWKPWDV
jgi:Uma2 family endonuclease